MLSIQANITRKTTGNMYGDDPLVLKIFILTICYCTCFWTILVHGLLILCFYINRKLPWVKKAKGILSLIVTDFISGFSFLLLLSTHGRSAVKQYACVVPLGTYMAAQLFVSLQILKLCVNRLIIVLKHTKQPIESNKRTIVQFFVLYIVSIGAVMTFLSWVQWKGSYNACTPRELTGENMRKACIIMLVIFTVPNFITTCIYLSIVCLLKAKSSTVLPESKVPQSSPSTIMEQRGSPRAINDELSSKQTEIDNFNFAMRKHWQKAVVTIGLILLLNNLAVFPYICVLSYQTAKGVTERVPAYLWLGSGLFLQANSALSPFVYGLKVKAVNAAFKNTLYMLCCKCKLVH